MQEHLFNHVNIDASATHVPDGSNPDADAAAPSTTRWSRLPAIPICSCSALATTGILASTSLTTCSQGHALLDLPESTIEANSRLFDNIEDVPRQAYTMGIQTYERCRMVWWWPTARRRRPRPCTICASVPSTPSARLPSCSCIPTAWSWPTRPPCALQVA